jgi:uncharacterized membrane protein YeaQ/YmgE (transglycosylase-associated protein family)
MGPALRIETTRHFGEYFTLEGPMNIQFALSKIFMSPLADTVVVDNNDRTMGIIAWLVVGLVAGFLGSKIVNKRGEGVLMDIVLGLVGAMVGGFLFSLLGIHTSGSLIYSIIVATIGAVLVLVVYHKVIRGGHAL